MKKNIQLCLITSYLGVIHPVYAGFWDWVIPTTYAPDLALSHALANNLTHQEASLASELIRTGNPEIERRYQNAKQDLILAQLSDAIYDSASLQDWELLEEERATISTGFHGGVYKNKKTGQLVLAYEGTTPKLAIGTTNDIITDIHLTTGGFTWQQKQALAYAKEVMNRYGTNITVTGHSLGGNLAQTVALQTGLNAVTFNSASVGKRTPDTNTTPGRIRNWLMTGDFVNPGSQLWGISGQNYGEVIYIDSDEGLSIEHSITTIIKNLKSMSDFYDSYTTNKYNMDNNCHNACKTNNLNTLTNVSQNTQRHTSHFGTPNIGTKPIYNSEKARQTIQENPYLAKGSMTLEAPADIVLRWGNHPADLDSHLTGPVRANSSERFHIHFENKGSLTGNPNAMLYRDDTSHGAGSTNRPEQTRINVTQPGVYNFYVHDFSNKGSQNSKALSQSEATVTLYSAGNRNLPEGNNLGKQVGRPIPVPKDKVGTVWHSFELDTRRNTLTPKDTMSNDRNIIK